MKLNLTDENFDIELKKMLNNIEAIKADVDLYEIAVEEQMANKEMN